MLQHLCLPGSYHPFDQAVHYKKTKLSYGQLDAYLEQCNAALSYHSYSNIILIVMDKGIELVLSTLSVFLSNHVFCILDMHTTADGFRQILSETKPNVVFTDAKNFNRVNTALSGNNTHIVQFHFDETSQSLSFRRHGNMAPAFKCNLDKDVSHIIYTSGSTAAPKGILCSKKAMWHFIKWEHDALQIQSKINVSQMSAPWFEPFLRDLFLPLFCGGCICIPTKREEFDPNAFSVFLREKKIDVLHIVPTMFRHLFLNSSMEAHPVAHILLAGEMLYGTDVDKYYSKYPAGTLYNLYGPSETTMARFFYPITADDRNDFRIKVGRPLPGTTFCLISDTGEPVSGQNAGEVVICTKHGSHGYYHRETAEKSFTFLKNGSTVFQTGDIGRVHADGNLELLGRRDYMRKVYGQKVYPEEIESAINQYEKVKKSIAVIEGNKIAAVLEIQDGFSINALSEIINRTLIPYKRPHFIYVTDKIAVNKSGKLDRKYLQKISDIPYTKKFMI